MGLLLNEYEVSPVKLSCSYCDNVMLFTKESVKRPVPQGARDMDIYDEVSFWRCIECEQTSTDFLTECKNCDNKVVSYKEDTGGGNNNMKKLSPRFNKGTVPADYPKISGFFLDEGHDLSDTQPEQCLNCLTCYECSQRIYDEASYTQKFNAIFSAKTDSNSDIVWYKYFFLHKDCVEKSPLYKSYQEENKQIAEAANKKSGCTASLLLMIVVISLLITSLVAVVSAVSSSNIH